MHFSHSTGSGYKTKHLRKAFGMLYRCTDFRKFASNQITICKFLQRFFSLL